MECRITTSVPLPDLPSIERVMLYADPAAVFDLDADRRTLRVATSLGIDDVRALLRTLGCEVAREQVAVLPSICCGGCSA
jgi:hypothetical protein